MLLRSASLPILTSWIPATARDHSLDHGSGDAADLITQIPRGRVGSHPSPSISLSSSSTTSPSLKRMMTRAMSENDLSNLSAAPKRPISLEDENGGEGEEAPAPVPAPASMSLSISHLLSNSGLVGVEGMDGCCAVDAKNRSPASTVALGGGCAGGSGKIGGGGGGDGFSDSNSSNDGIETYYLKLIKCNPGNSLVLGNYARFLKDVRGDLDRAEEYCERAILANPVDSDVLTLYADLIWQTKNDSQRAGRYFDRAVQAAPQDCYVMATYARFLWETEEEDEMDGVKVDNPNAPPLFQPSIAAA